jgi:ribosome-binding factor A
MSDRMLKVNSLLREIIAEELERMNDTRLEMVSVTGVETAPNLRHAVVYVDVLDEPQRTPALAALDHAANRLQSAIGRQARMKYTPTLSFAIDPGVLSGERIDSILRELAGREEEE